MLESELQSLIEDVRDGRLPRRSFIGRMAALGLGAPMAGMMLLNAGVAQAQALPAYKPTKRGGGGDLRILAWQGATQLNPHLSLGTADLDSCRIFYEPLASFDSDGNIIPILAAEAPSRENGGVAADGKSVVWKLKKGVTWHDGKPFTADDCVFTWQYASDPATAAASVGIYRAIQVEKIDSHTIRLKFAKPTPFWAKAFCGWQGMVLPKHVFASHIGAKAREAPANLKPVGTGPFKFVDFKPGDMLHGAIDANYHVPNRPYFDTVSVKSGGDAVSAARAVLQTGEGDYALSSFVEEEVLKRLARGGKGTLDYGPPSGIVDFVLLNYADPNTEVDGERSNPKTRHPCFSDPAVREAMGLLIDRQSIQQFVYGSSTIATANIITAPPRFVSQSLKPEFNPEKANSLLEAAGWKKGGDGVRAKDGKRLAFVFQASTNAPRQKTQAIIKQSCEKAGISIEIKSVPGSIFFSSDVGNNDTSQKFYADMEALTNGPPGPDPEGFLEMFTSTQIASKSNNWAGRNMGRWRNEEYDKLFARIQIELDPAKRAALVIQANDVLCRDGYVIPQLNRRMVSAVANKLVTIRSNWDSTTWALNSWYRET